VSRGEAPGALERALELSRELLEAAESEAATDARTVDLNAQRLHCLQAARSAGRPRDEAQRALLREINELNDRAIGRLEHRRRTMERQMETVTTGRRAVAAYSSTRR
jgi:hypothetical protein